MKKILLLLVVMITCGCTASYTVEIGDITLEQLEAVPDKTIETEYLYFKSFENETKINNFSSKGTQYYYDLNIDDDKGSLSFKYKEIEGLNLSKILSECFDERSIVNNENTYIINLSGFLCTSYSYLDVTDLKLNVKTQNNYIIEESNANYYTSNNATWNYDENFDKISIKIRHEEENEKNNDINSIPESEENPVSEKSDEEKQKDRIFSIYVVIGGFFSFIIVLLIVIIFTKKKQ